MASFGDYLSAKSKAAISHRTPKWRCPSKTPNKYRRSGKLHQDFCRAQRIAYWNDFGKRELETYGRDLNSRLAARSQYFELTQVKTVLNWLIDEKHLPRESGFRFRLSRPEGNETYCYTPQQIQAMLKRCDNDRTLHWQGNITRVLTCTGLGIGELVGLRWTDLDFEGGAIRLTDERASHRRSTMGTARRTKGKHSRTIPLHPDVRLLLEQLPREKHGHVLVGPKGGKIKEDRIRERFVDQVITPLSVSFPTPKGETGFEHARFHSFRHYFISQAFIAGVTEAEIMEWVGHRDSKTVAIDRHLRNEDSLRRMEQIHFVTRANPEGPENAA